MRVIAGSLKGRRLAAPTWQGLRPTSDKLRETLFNVLAGQMAGARVLDAYAGTGALGIEALSRGAAAVTFVEHDRRAQDLIEENLDRCGIRSGYAIIRASVARALQTLDPFDIVLLDPPYDEPADAVLPVLEQVTQVLAPGAVVVLEHARRHPMPAAVGRLIRVREIPSGDSMLSIYRAGT